VADYCFSAIDMLALRVTLLENDGTPDGGASNLYVTDDPIQLSQTPRVTTGATSEQKNGRGIPCAGKTAKDTLTGWTLAGTFCKFEVEMLQLMFGGTLLLGGTGGTESIGLADPDPADERQFGVAIEAWSAAYDGVEEQGNFPSATTGLAYIHWAFPRVQCMPGPEEVKEGVIVQSWTGLATPNPNFGPGPDNLWPATLQGPRGKWYTNSLPTAACGASVLIS
jgi:hypothetical protein